MISICRIPKDPKTREALAAVARLAGDELEKRPHECGACDGRGIKIVYPGLGPQGIDVEISTCRRCKGWGLIWPRGHYRRT